MNDPMLQLPGLSPVWRKRVEVKFNDGMLLSDGGVLALREIEKRLGLADRVATRLVDPRRLEQVTHSFADLVRFRMMMVAAGYEVDPHLGPTAPKSGCRYIKTARKVASRFRLLRSMSCS